MKRTLTLCATIGALFLSCVLAWAPNDPECTPPTITSPGGQTQCQGGSVTFSVNPSGSSPFSYTWYKWDPSSATWHTLSNGGNISGSDSPNLRINPIGTGD